MEDELPHRRVIRRSEIAGGGPDMGRILSLSDGIFAFAMTLLVLELTVPVLPATLTKNSPSGVLNGWLGAALIRDIPTFSAFALAFVLIGLWWMIHTRTFARIRRWDQTLLWLNLVFLLMIAITPFILGVLENPAYGETTVAVAVYAGAEGFTGFVLVAMWWYASEGHRLIDPELDAALIRYYREIGVGRASVFVLSFALAFWNPQVALYSFVLVFVAQYAVQRRHNVERRHRGERA